MHKVEFESEIHQGMIKVPAEYHDLGDRHIRVIAIIEDDGRVSSIPVPPVEVFRTILRLAAKHPVVIPGGVDVVTLPEQSAHDIL